MNRGHQCPQGHSAQRVITAIRIGKPVEYGTHCSLCARTWIRERGASTGRMLRARGVCSLALILVLWRASL